MMQNNEMRRRLDNIESSLSPRQAIILAMENATSRFNSLSECTEWLDAHPGERLLGDPSEVWATFGKRLKKEKPAAVITSILRELAGRAVLAHLWLDLNRYIGEVTQLELLRLALLVHRNSEVMDHIQMWGAAKVRAILSHHAKRMDWDYGDEIVLLLQDLFEADFTAAAVRRSCFDGHQVLFDELKGKLGDQLFEAQELAGSYNRLLDLVFTAHQSGAGSGMRPSTIEIDKIRQAAEDRSKLTVAALVGKAKSEVRIGIDCSNRARKMMGPVVKQLENYFR